VNYFELYPGDYLRDTTRLTLIEHGAYLRLLMAYYAEEEPLPADHAELYVIAGAVSNPEKAAVKKVADRHFPVGEDGLRHNSRADEEIAKASARMEASPTGRKATQAERAKRYRDRRSAMFSLLREHGVVLDFNAKAEELEAAVMALASRNSRDERDGKRDAGHDVSRDERDGVHRDVTASRPQTPDPSISVGGSEARTEISHGAGTDAGRACQLMRQAGCTKVNPSHPDLLAALAEGVKPEAIRDAYVATPDARNPFAYAIATARGLHADGAKQVATGPPRRSSTQASRTRTALENLQGRKTDELPTAMAQERGPRRLEQAGDVEP
jgi:uncharacterized protein YdaU (DUF1376 family)